MPRDSKTASAASGSSSSSSSSSNGTAADGNDGDGDCVYSWFSGLQFAALSVVQAPALLRDNVAHLCDIVGTKFVLSTMIIYGVQQGLSSSWFSQARDYFFKDVLLLEPAAAQVYVAIAQVPWSIKPIYGMASDFLPIGGYHRIPYICIAGVLSTTCFALLTTMGSAGTLSARLAVLLLFGANVSVASPDVMVDSMVAEHTKHHPRASTDLQSLLWGSLSLCAVGGFLSSGYLISTIGPVRLFGVLTFVGVLVFLPGAFNWLGEKPNRVVSLGNSSSSSGGGSGGSSATAATSAGIKVGYSTLDVSETPGTGTSSNASTINALHSKSTVDIEMVGAPSKSSTTSTATTTSKPADGHQQHVTGSNIRTFLGCLQVDMDFVAEYRDILVLASTISFLALLVGGVALLFEDFHVRLATVLCVALSVVALVVFMTRQRYSLIGTTGLFFFSVTALAPDTDTAMFYWYTDYEGGPQFTPRFVGYISALSFGAMFVGILVYNRFLSGWEFRRTFYYFITLAALLGIPDITLIMRWNLKLGISDEWFVFGEAAIAPILRRCTAMPLYIIAAKVCPEGAEATVFAMLTALGNFGAAVSSYVGASLLIIFNIDSSNYDNFVWLILVKMCFRLCTLLLIPLLVPHGCPLDAVVSFDPDEVKPAEPSGHGYSSDNNGSSSSYAEEGGSSSSGIKRSGSSGTGRGKQDDQDELFADESSRSTHHMLPKDNTTSSISNSANSNTTAATTKTMRSPPRRFASHDTYALSTSQHSNEEEEEQAVVGAASGGVGGGAVPPSSSLHRSLSSSSGHKVDTSGFFQHIELNSSSSKRL